jgi:hypothetical protein
MSTAYCFDLICEYLFSCKILGDESKHSKCSLDFVIEMSNHLCKNDRAESVIDRMILTRYVDEKGFRAVIRTITRLRDIYNEVSV